MIELKCKIKSKTQKSEPSQFFCLCMLCQCHSKATMSHMVVFVVKSNMAFACKFVTSFIEPIFRIFKKRFYLFVHLMQPVLHGPIHILMPIRKCEWNAASTGHHGNEVAVGALAFEAVQWDDLES